jgi:peptide-methionine (S)-S-oxide reductase
MHHLPIAVSALAVALSATPSLAAEAVHVIPPPAIDEQNSTDSTATAVLAGGCYWGMQGVFEHVKGVTKVIAGFAGSRDASDGGSRIGASGLDPAESIEITYDPHQISYGQLLQIFFSVAHDPTELNRQGPDSGTRYRSDIFYSDPEQQKIAEAYVAQLDKSGIFSAPIVTRVDLWPGFHKGEPSQQDYIIKHPDLPYVVINDLPKIENLKRLFPDRFVAAAVTVGS